MAAKKVAKTAASNGVGKGPGAGWTKVDTRVNGFWKPDTVGQFIEGVCVQRIEGAPQVDSDGSPKKPNIYFAIRLSDDSSGPIKTTDGKILKVDAGHLAGVSGATLQLFLGERIGQAVHIVYKGLGKARPGQSAPKLFDTYEASPATES